MLQPITEALQCDKDMEKITKIDKNDTVQFVEYKHINKKIKF